MLYQGLRQLLEQKEICGFISLVPSLLLARSFYFSITKIEWLFILLAIGGMFALELVNTAIERVVDLVTEEYHPLAKQAKDLAAGAVFSLCYYCQ